MTDEEDEEELIPGSTAEDYVEAEPELAETAAAAAPSDDFASMPEPPERPVFDVTPKPPQRPQLSPDPMDYPKNVSRMNDWAQRTAEWEEKENAKTAQKQFMESRRAHNAGAREVSAATGAQFNYDADGVARPRVDPQTGEQAFTKRVSPVRWDEQGRPFQVIQNEQGTRSERIADPDANAAIGPNPTDPEDKSIYRKTKFQPWEAIDPEEGINSTDGRVVRASAKALFDREKTTLKRERDEISLSLRDPARPNRLSPEARQKVESEMQGLTQPAPPPAEVKGMFGGVNVEATEAAKKKWQEGEAFRTGLLTEKQAMLAADDERAGLETRAYELDQNLFGLEKMPLSEFVQERRKKKAESLANLDPEAARAEIENRATAIAEEDAATETAMQDLQRRSAALNERTKKGITIQEMESVATERAAIEADAAGLEERIAKRNAAAGEVMQGVEAIKAKEDAKREESFAELDRQAAKYPELAEDAKAFRAVDADYRSRMEALQQQPEGPGKLAAVEALNSEFETKRKETGSAYVAKLEKRISGDVGAAIEKVAGPGGALGFKSQIEALENDAEIDPEIKKIATEVIRDQAVDALIRANNMKAVGPAVKSDKEFSEAFREAGAMDPKNPEHRARALQMLEQDPGLGAKLLDGFDRVMTTFGARMFGAVSAVGKAISHRMGLDPDNIISQAADAGYDYKLASEEFREKYRDPRLETEEAMNRWIMPAVSEALPNLAGMALTAIPVVGPALAVTFNVGQLYDEAYSTALRDEELTEDQRHNAATIYAALALPAELIGDVVSGGVFTSRMIPKAAKQQSAEAAAKFWSKFTNVGEVWDKLPPVLKRGVAIVAAGGTEGLTETVQDKILDATIETIKTGNIGDSVSKALADNRGALDTFIIASISGGGIKTLETATRTFIERGQNPEEMARRYNGVANSFRLENVIAFAEQAGASFDPKQYETLTQASEGLVMRLDRINPKDKLARNDVARELANVEAKRLTMISEILGKNAVDQAMGGQQQTQTPAGTPPPPVLPENIAAMQAEIGQSAPERQAPLATAIKILSGAPMDSLTKAEQDAIKPHVAKVGGQTVLTEDILSELSQTSPQAAALMQQGSIRDEATRRLEILATEKEGGETNEKQMQQKGPENVGQGTQGSQNAGQNDQGVGTGALTPGGAAGLPSLPPLPVGRGGALISKKEKKVADTLAARLVQSGADKNASQKFADYFVKRETLKGWGTEKLNAAVSEFQKAGGMQNPQAILASIEASDATQRTEIENFTNEVLKKLDSDPKAASMTGKDRENIGMVVRNQIAPSLLRFRPIIRGVVAAFDKSGDTDVQVNNSEQLIINAAYMLADRGVGFWANTENTDLLIDEEVGHISQFKVLAENRRERTGEDGDDSTLAFRESEEIFLQLPETVQQASRKIYGAENLTPAQSGMEFFRQMLQGDIALSEGRVLDTNGKVIAELAIKDRAWIDQVKSMFERLFKVFTDLRGNLGTMMRDEGRSDAEIEEFTTRVEKIRKDSLKFFQNLKKEGDRIRGEAYGQEYARLEQSSRGQRGGIQGDTGVVGRGQPPATPGNRLVETQAGADGQLSPAGTPLGSDQAARLAELESKDQERQAREERAKERRAEYVNQRAGDLKDYDKVVEATPEDAREPVRELLTQAPSGNTGYVLAVNQRRLPSTWVALPPGVVQTSHIGPNFQKNPEYAGQNTRAYDSDPAEQNKVRAGALPGALNEDILTSTDPSSANSAPQVAIVIDVGPDGQPRARWQAAGGNAREMMSNLAPQEDQDRLSQTWNEKGAQFGFEAMPEGFRGYRFLGTFDIRTEAGARDYQKLVDDLNPSTGVVQDVSDRADLDAKNIPLDLVADLPVMMSGKQAVEALSRLLTAPGNIVERNRIEPMAKNPAQAQAYMQRMMFSAGLGQPKLTGKVADYQLQNRNAAFVELSADSAKAAIALRQSGNPGIADALGGLLSNVADYLDEGRSLKTALDLAASQIEMDALVGDTAVATEITKRLVELVAVDKRGRINSESTSVAMKDYMVALASGISRASEDAAMGDMFGAPMTMAERIAAINAAHRRQPQPDSETTLSAATSNTSRRMRELELKRRQEGLTSRETQELVGLEQSAGQQFMDFFDQSRSQRFELEQEVERRGIERAPVEQMDFVLSAAPSQRRKEAAEAFKPKFRPFVPSAFLSGEQQQVEKDFYDQILAEPFEAERAYAELEGTEGGRVLDMDEARELSGVYSQSKMSRTLHAGSVQQAVRTFIVDYMLEKKFSTPAPGETYIGLTAGGPGSGKSRIKKLNPEEWDAAEFVYDGTLQNFNGAQTIIKQATQSGRFVKIWYVHVPIEQAVKQAVDRTARAGRALGLPILSSAHYNSQQVIIRLLKEYPNDPNFSITVIDNTDGVGKIVEDPLTFLTSESIQYREPNETETRAKKELAKHIQTLVPAGRRIWLSQSPQAAEFGGIEGRLAPVWRRGRPLPPATDRAEGVNLSAARSRRKVSDDQLAFDFTAPAVQDYREALEADGITHPVAQAAAAQQDIGLPATEALDLFTYQAAVVAKPAPAPRTVYRTEEPGVEIGDPNKPQGLYLETSPDRPLAGDLGGTTQEFTFNPTNPLDVSGKVEGIVGGRYGITRQSPIELSAGIKAAQTLLGEEEFARLNALPQTELIAELTTKYPGVEWGRYYDNYERLETVGAIEARNAGYDALEGGDEVVALADSALAAVESTAPQVEAETPAEIPAPAPQEVSNDTTLSAAPSQSSPETLRMEIEELSTNSAAGYTAQLEAQRASGKLLLAPNGNPSRLTPKQWAVARTPSFKNQFGDWESSSKLNALEAMDSPDMTSPTLVGREVYDLRREAMRLHQQQKTDGFTLPDGRTISITSRGFKEIKQHAADKRVLHISANLKNLLGRAIPLWSEKNNDQKYPNVVAFHNYGTRASFEGVDSLIRFLIREDNNGQIHYDHDATSFEVLDSSDAGKLPDQPTRTPNPGEGPEKLAHNSLFSWWQKVKSSTPTLALDENGEPLAETVEAFAKPLDEDLTATLSAARRQTYDPNQLELDFDAAPRDQLAAQEDADKSAAARFQSGLEGVMGLASAYSNIPGVDLDEVRQTARIALADAARTFDASRGVPFGPYSSIVVRNRLNSLYRRESLRRERIPQSLDEPLPGDFTETRQDYTPDTATPDAPTTASRNEARRLIDDLIAALPDRMRAAVDGYLQQRQQEEIGEQFGISKQAVSRLQQEGFKRLRQKLTERGIDSVSELLSAARKNPLTDTLAESMGQYGIPAALPLDAQGGMGSLGIGPAAQPAQNPASAASVGARPGQLGIPAEQPFAGISYAPAREWGIRTLAERFQALRNRVGGQPIQPPIFRRDFPAHEGAFREAAQAAENFYRDTLARVDAANADRPGVADRLLPRLPEVRELFTDANGQVQLLGSRPAQLEPGEALFAASGTPQDDGDFIAPGESFESDLENLLNDLNGVPADIDSAVAKQEQAALEEGGGQRYQVGRPDLAFGANNPDVRGLDQFYTDRFLPETEAQWETASRDMVAKDFEGTRRSIEKAGLAGQTISPELTKAADQIANSLRQKMIQTGKDEDRRAFNVFWYAYRATGTEAGRALASRRDPFKTPAMRHREFLMDLMLTPGKKDKARIDAEPDPAKKSALIDSVTAALLKKLKDAGITPEDILGNRVVVGLNNAEIQRQFRDALTPKQAEVFDLLLRKNQTPAQIAQRTGMKPDAVEAVFTAFKNRMRQQHLAKFKAGIHKQSEVTLGAAPAQSGLFGGQVSDAEADAAFDQWFSGMVGTTDTKKIGRPKFRIDDPAHVVRLARAIQSARGEAGLGDMAYEWWIMNILSGPQTQVVNIAGNTGFLALDTTLQRGVEALVNVFVRDQKAARLGEFRALARGILPGITKGLAMAAKAWSAEHDFYEHTVLGTPLELGQSDKLGNTRAAIPGQAGRIVRIPGRSLLFADSFFKQLSGQMNVAAFAYRIAKAEGLRGQALTARVAQLSKTRGEIVSENLPSANPSQEMVEYFARQLARRDESLDPAALVANRSSEAWELAREQAAYDSAKTAGWTEDAWIRAVEKSQEMTFQQDLKRRSEGGSLFEDAAAKLQDARFNNQLIGFFFPFVKTPYNIFRTGIRKSPLGAANLAFQAGKGLLSMKDGKPFLDGDPTLVRDMSEQLIAWTAMALIFGAVQGDEDDDEKMLLITGSQPRSESSAGLRDLNTRATGGEYVIRIGGRNGITIPYGRLDPIATVLGTTTDLIRSIKRNGTPTENLASVWNYMVAQTNSKTFLQGIANIATILEGKSDPVGATQRTLLQALVPNIIRQPLRNLDDYVRDTKTAPATYTLLPSGNLAEPKVDVYGNEIRKGSNPVMRLFLNSALATEPVLQSTDELLLNWNRANPSMAYAPQQAEAIYKGRDGKEVAMTAEETRRYRLAAGRLASVKLRAVATPNRVANPTEQDIQEIRNAFSEARREVRERMFAGR